MQYNTRHGCLAALPTIFLRSASKSSKQFLARQRDDPYSRFKSAPRGPQLEEGRVLISRAHHKLAEIDTRHNIIRSGSVIVDLGSAPGGWLEYAHRKVARGGGMVLGVDLNDTQLDHEVPFVKGDFLDPATQKTLAARLRAANKSHVDVVLSDMLHNVTGNRDVDGARSIELVQAAMMFALKHFAANQGIFLAKYYQGADADDFLKYEVKAAFQTVQILKPESSRKESRECYMLAKRGPPRGLRTAGAFAE